MTVFLQGSHSCTHNKNPLIGFDPAVIGDSPPEFGLYQGSAFDFPKSSLSLELRRIPAPNKSASKGGLHKDNSLAVFPFHCTKHVLPSQIHPEIALYQLQEILKSQRCSQFI
jgi:hypothetical protein